MMLFKPMLLSLCFLSVVNTFPLEAQWCEEVCLPCQEEDSVLYATVGGGYVMPSKNSRTRGDSSAVLYTPTTPGTSLFTLPDVTWKNKYKSGFEVSAALGAKMKSGARLEGEFLYQNFKRKISGRYDWREVDAITTLLFAQNFDNPLVHRSSNVNIYSLLANASFDYALFRSFSFSLGGGVGVAWIDSKRKEEAGILHIVTQDPPLNESSPTLEKSAKLFGTAFAWQFKAGLKYALLERFSIGLNYRLFGTTRFQASTSRITTNPGTSAAGVFKVPRDEVRGLLNNTISLAVEYTF